jgi:hypothetical protein
LRKVIAPTFVQNLARARIVAGADPGSAMGHSLDAAARETAAGWILTALIATAAILVALAASRSWSAGGRRGQLRVTPAPRRRRWSPATLEQDWMRDHYESMRGCALLDQALDWAPPASFYQDLYALYPHSEADLELIEEHPEFVLRDAAGHKLYIPFACEGGTCQAWAADVDTRSGARRWISAPRRFDKGYVGVFTDNVLMEMKVSDGWENLVAPIDPRTGQPMTETLWRLYVAEFVRRSGPLPRQGDHPQHAGGWTIRTLTSSARSRPPTTSRWSAIQRPGADLRRRGSGR